jgi:hypothetical protein
MSVVRLQFEYWLSLPYTLPLGLCPLPSLSPKLGTRLREGCSARAEAKPLPFQYTGSVFRSDSDTFPLYLDPFVLLIRTSSLRRISDLRRIPVGNRYLTATQICDYPWQQVPETVSWVSHKYFYRSTHSDLQVTHTCDEPYSHPYISKPS